MRRIPVANARIAVMGWVPIAGTGATVVVEILPLVSALIAVLQRVPVAGASAAIVIVILPIG